MGVLDALVANRASLRNTKARESSDFLNSISNAASMWQRENEHKAKMGQQQQAQDFARSQYQDQRSDMERGRAETQSASKAGLEMFKLQSQKGELKPEDLARIQEEHGFTDRDMVVGATLMRNFPMKVQPKPAKETLYEYESKDGKILNFSGTPNQAARFSQRIGKQLFQAGKRPQRKGGLFEETIITNPVTGERVYSQRKSSTPLSKTEGALTSEAVGEKKGVMTLESLLSEIKGAPDDIFKESTKFKFFLNDMSERFLGTETSPADKELSKKARSIASKTASYTIQDMREDIGSQMTGREMELKKLELFKYRDMPSFLESQGRTRLESAIESVIEAKKEGLARNIMLLKKYNKKTYDKDFWKGKEKEIPIEEVSSRLKKAEADFRKGLAAKGYEGPRLEKMLGIIMEKAFFALGE